MLNCIKRKRIPSLFTVCPFAFACIMNSVVFLPVIICVLCNLFHIFATSFKSSQISENGLFPVSLIHINDFHARFEETNEAASTCKQSEKCIGGYARAVTVIKELQRIRKNPIYLNAGDNFQGTFWYTVGGWDVTSEFLNLLNADAITLGNHEFDRGVEGVVPFLEHLNSPVVVANIDDSDEPSFQGKYQKTIVIDRFERKIGVIGVIVSTVNEIANTGNLRFYEEVETVRREAEQLKAQGVDIIIVLSHCGLDIDYRIAKETAPLIDVIVGGHTHTFMYTVEEGKKAPGPDKVGDVYPAVVESEDGHRVLIVQASARMKYVGDLIVFFDNDGRVASWQGAPIFLDTDIQQDPEVLAAIQPWKETIDAEGMRTVGLTKVSMPKKPCEFGECNLGNFIADAFAHYYITSFPTEQEAPWIDPVVVLINAGALRATINPGPITYSDLAMTIPFEDNVHIFDLRGDHLKDVFEHAVEREWPSKPSSKTSRPKMKFFVQVSGAKIVYNMTKEPLNRVVSIDVITMKRHIPIYEPLDINKYYRCMSNAYLADGGDAFYMIPKYKKNHKKGMIDMNVVIQYLENRKIIYTGQESRIKFKT